MTSTAETIVRAYRGDWHGSYGLIPTPGHSPKDRGVTVKDADNGDVVFHSFNGGDWKALKDECRSKGLLPEREVPQRDNVAAIGGAWRETGHYEYVGPDGVVAYRTVRKEKRGEAKKFAAQRPDGKGGWTPGMGDVPRILYRLPELIAADPAKPVLFVEGERKADKLAEWGFVATAIAFGSNGWRAEYADALADRRVIILPDNDDPGRKFADTIADALRRVGTDVSILTLPCLPPAGDIIDWSGQGGSAFELQALIDAPAVVAAALPTINPADWHGREVPLREWRLEGWIPLRQATLLTGKGGVGKSLYAQLLATCTALGLPCLGVATTQTPSLYVSCEDDPEELQRRQSAICAGLGVPMSALDGKLLLASLAGEAGNQIARFDPTGRLLPTDRWHQIEAACAASSIGFVALDNASHMMGGDHNDLTHVAAFLNLLNGLAIERNGAVLILHHPNKAGDDWLGSVAWENQVRSRIILKPSDIEGDHDARSLQNPKANYAPSGGRIDFRWHRGSFVIDRDLPPNMVAEIAATAQMTAGNEAFLRCLAAATESQRAVSHNPGSNFAPNVFAKMPEGKGWNEKQFAAAMERLLHLRKIALDQPLWRGPNRVMKQGIKLAESAPTPLHEPLAPTCTKPSETLHASTPLGTTYQSGAADAAATPAVKELGRPVFGPRGEILKPGETPARGWLGQ